MHAVTSVRCHNQRAALWAQFPDIRAAQELDAADDAQQSFAGGEAETHASDCTGAQGTTLIAGSIGSADGPFECCSAFSKRQTSLG